MQKPDARRKDLLKEGSFLLAHFPFSSLFRQHNWLAKITSEKLRIFDGARGLKKPVPHDYYSGPKSTERKQTMEKCSAGK